MPTGFDFQWLAAHEAKMAGIKRVSLPPIPDTFTFIIPFLLKSPNELNGRSPYILHDQRKRLRPVVQQACMTLRGREPIQRAMVTITRYSTGVEMDDDNAMASGKPVRDLLLVKSKTHPHSVGLIVDDSPAHMVSVSKVVRIRKRTEQRTEVLIERMD